MKRIMAVVAVLALLPAGETHAAQAWTEGKHYVLLSPVQRTNLAAGKVEVMEVFSYACPACDKFRPTMDRLRGGLPSNAQLVFLPASFNPGEDWPMFQRAYFAAQSLGIAARTHEAMFNAVWQTGELAIMDATSHRLKNPQPSLQDAARCYARLAGVSTEAFLAAAKSFAVDVKVKSADAQITAMQVPETPCIVVNGKYRLVRESLHSNEELVELVKFLVAKETHQA